MLIKAIQTFVLSTALLVSSLSLGQFQDIPKDHWALGYMQNAYEKGWMTGKNEATFDPDGKLSRAELVTLLHRFDGSKMSQSIKDFRDTDSSAWYAPSLNWAASNGIIEGYAQSDGMYFKPDKPVSRQEVWTILERFAGKEKNPYYNLEKFSDSDRIASFAVKGARWCASKGILSGKIIGEQRLADPEGICTRAESCKILSVLSDLPAEDSQQPASQGLSVQNGKLVDAQGNPLILQGISSHGLAWYGDYINPYTLASLKNLLGINAIRLAMYTEEYGGYCSGGDQQTLKRKILEGVKQAKDQGMYAIIDWHILSDSNPLTHADEASAFFDEISQSLSQETHVLYEVCNEPNGSVSWQQIKTYAQQIIPVIRANDPDAVIIVGTPQWSQRVDLAASSPLSYENILYSLHFYAATHHEDLFNLAQQALDAGLPMIITEFGISEASGSGRLDEAWARKWMNWAHDHAISTFAWSLSDKDESSALLIPGTVAGTIRESDLSSAGNILKSLYGNGSSTQTPKDSGSNGNSSQKPADDSDQSSSSETGFVFKVKNEANLTVEETIREEWAEGNKKVLLLRYQVKNSGPVSVPVSFSLEVTSDFTLRQSWNAEIIQSGKILNVQGPDWKKTLGPSETLQDLGLIIELQ